MVRESHVTARGGAGQESRVVTRTRAAVADAEARLCRPVQRHNEPRLARQVVLVEVEAVVQAGQCGVDPVGIAALGRQLQPAVAVGLGQHGKEGVAKDAQLVVLEEAAGARRRATGPGKGAGAVELRLAGRKCRCD